MNEDINDSPMLVPNRPSAPTSSEVPMKDFDNDLDKLALEPDTTGHNNIISLLLGRLSVVDLSEKVLHERARAELKTFTTMFGL